MFIQLINWVCVRWSAIAAKLPGRTDNEVKNYWHTHLKKRIELHDNNNNNNLTPNTTCSPQTINMSKEAEIFNNEQDVKYGIDQSKEQLYSLLLVQELEAEASFNHRELNDKDYWFNLFLKAAGSSTDFNAH